MKTMVFRRNKDVNRGTKFLQICSRYQDKECSTIVRKGFLYKVKRAPNLEPKIESPQVYIRKYIDTRAGIEKFSFRVKGTFYMTHERVLMQVDFHHSLHIKIIWKNKKNFSPKKSESLT